MIFKGFPPESFIFRVVQTGSMKDLRPTFWVYLTAMILGSIASLFWQFRILHQRDNTEEYKRHINYRQERPERSEETTQ